MFTTLAEISRFTRGGVFYVSAKGRGNDGYLTIADEATASSRKFSIHAQRDYTGSKETA